MRFKITILFLLFFVNSFSQNDSIQKLEEIVLKGSFSSSLNNGYTVKIISDTVLNQGNSSLGNILQNYTNLYFKQNGNGLVSSISLRGSGASHTGVYWNGIAINSTLNGQTDFNTIRANSFDEIEIRRGGGSVLLGSGAIGGAINLKDKITFQESKEVNFHIGLASYNTQESFLKGKYSNHKLFAKISLGGSRSDNDYPYLGTELLNENGEYKNYSFNGVFAYQFNNRNQLHLMGSVFDNDRNISNTLTVQSKAKLLNVDSRVMLDWKYLGDKYTSSFKTAYLKEDFTYSFNKDLEDSSIGKSENIIFKYDLNYFLNKAIFFRSGVEYKYSKGSGSSMTEVEQNDMIIYGLFHHQPISDLNYNFSIRKGFSSIYKIPLIYSLDANYCFTKQFVIKAAISSNYRLPSFNDLYWEPGGNIDLKPESSNSAEIGFHYLFKSIKLEMTSFYNKSEDLIQWQPVSGDFWQPVNIQDVMSYGLEFSAYAQKKIGSHKLDLTIQYDYTVSEDSNLDKQLIYVPFHKANSVFNYQFKKWNFTYNLQYTGEVFTTTSNTLSLDPYWLSNISLNRSFIKNKFRIGFKINNLFNQKYQSVAYRPMPNRNYILHINLII